MTKTWKVFLTVLTALVAVVLVACGQGTASKFFQAEDGIRD